MDIFSIMPVEVFMDDRLSKTDLRVLGAILSWRNKTTNLCWPKREQIAERCNLPLCKISTATTHLVELGWLEKKGDGGRSRSASYQLKIPACFLETGTDSVTVTDSVTKTVTDSVRGIKQTNEQTKGMYTRARELESGFLNFWSVYPKKKSKENARKAWLKLNPDEQLQQTIIDAVLRAKTQDVDWVKDGGQFIPHAATYLNGRRWDDEITTQKHDGGRYAASGKVGRSCSRNQAIADRITEDYLKSGGPDFYENGGVVRDYVDKSVPH